MYRVRVKAVWVAFYYCCVVRPSVVNFFTETTGRNSIKLTRKQVLNILYQVCVFWADQKTKMVPSPLIC